MTLSLDKLGLSLDLSSVSTTSQCFRPPSWPPPRDWVCIENKNGMPVSRWGDSVWDITPWVGKTYRLNFCDGPKLRKSSPSIDKDNADILRMILTWKIWGPGGFLNPITIGYFFKIFRPVIEVCSESKILATDLSKFPAVQAKLAQRLPSAKFGVVISELDLILSSKEDIGFFILDKFGIQLLKGAQPEHKVKQTEFIPPRIWMYMISRFKHCLDDYLTHEDAIEKCYRFCIDAYQINQSSISSERKKKPKKNPFNISKKNLSDRSNLGSFYDTAVQFGINDLLDKWIGFNIDNNIRVFSSYLSFITNIGSAYIANLTLMRKEEVGSLHADCLQWHNDEKFGRIPLICGETTKTVKDLNARWVASPSVDIAVSAMRSVALLRTGFVDEYKNKENPTLINWSLEPWSTGRKHNLKALLKGINVQLLTFSEIYRLKPKLFDLEELRITEEDYRIARVVCPTLDPEIFKCGETWRPAWHKFRRTGAVNMFASGIISDSSIQLQMKHQTRTMSLYYGRGNSSLRFNDNVRVDLVNAQYEAMGRELASINTSRFISPHGEQHKLKMLNIQHEAPVNLITEKDANRYEMAARSGEISFRRTALGGCMKNGHCDGDSISSIGICAGADGKAPCSHVLFDRMRAEDNKIRLAGVKCQLNETPPDTPRFRALKQEKIGLENYFDCITI